MAYPYHTEPTHDQGIVASSAGNKSRTTTVSAAEGRLIVDAADKIALLEPKNLLGSPIVI
jgi:hypothetical protein